jgi:hypothetical protein
MRWGVSGLWGAAGLCWLRTQVTNTNTNNTDTTPLADFRAPVPISPPRPPPAAVRDGWRAPYRGRLGFLRGHAHHVVVVLCAAIVLLH